MSERGHTLTRIMAHQDDQLAVETIRTLLGLPLGERRSVSIDLQDVDPTTNSERYQVRFYEHHSTYEVRAEIVICRHCDIQPVDWLVVSSTSNPRGHFTNSRQTIARCTPFEECRNVLARSFIMVFGTINHGYRHRQHLTETRQKQLSCAARQLVHDTLLDHHPDAQRPVSIANLNEQWRAVSQLPQYHRYRRDHVRFE